MTNDSTTSRGKSGVLDALDTSSVPTSVALVGFNVAVYAAVRYAPEYLRLLGNGPILIGLFGSAATLLAVLYPSLGSILDRLDGRVAPAIAALASLGVVCWLLAPQAGSGNSVQSVILVFVGLVLIESWHAFGIDTTVATTFVSGRVREHIPAVIRHTRTPRYAALLVGLPVVVGFLAAISPALAAIQVVLGLAAGIGLTVTVLLAVLDEFEGDAVRTVIEGERIGAVVRGERFRSILDALRSLPRASRQMLVGDTLVAVAVGMVSVFLIITVTSVLQIDVMLFGYRLRPDAYFGVCLFAETTVALVATGPVTRFASRVGRDRVVTGTLLVAALFPIALVSAPTNATVVALLFAVFGLYRAGLPTRRATIDSVVEGGTDNHGQYRTMRAMVRIPSALVGGLLYAISPTLAFGLATVVGAVGVREFFVGTTWPNPTQAESE